MCIQFSYIKEKFIKREGIGSGNVLNSPLVLGRVVLLLSLFFVLLAIPAAAEPVKVLVNAPAYVAEGGTFDAIIDVDNIKDFNRGLFDFSFNSRVVIVTDIVKGELEYMPTPPVNRVHNIDTGENFRNYSFDYDWIPAIRLE